MMAPVEKAPVVEGARFDFDPRSWMSEGLAGAAMNLLGAVAILLIGWWLARRVVKLADAALERMEAEEIIRGFMRNAVFAALMVVVIVAALQKVGVPTTSLLAMLGAQAWRSDWR